MSLGFVFTSFFQNTNKDRKKESHVTVKFTSKTTSQDSIKRENYMKTIAATESEKDNRNPSVSVYVCVWHLKAKQILRFKSNSVEHCNYTLDLHLHASFEKQRQ